MEVVGSAVFSFKVYFISCLLCVDFSTEVIQRLTEKERKMSAQDAVDYLKKFGYLQHDNITSNQPFALLDSRLKSDVFKNLPSSGNISNQTGAMDGASMKTFQCGVPDNLPNDRRKREAAWKFGWNKALITYFVGETYKISRDAARIELKDAFDFWAKQSKLTFVEISEEDKADIVILFRSKNHGDMFPFDGKGHNLAHAFPPSDYHGLSGDIHFDNDENWVINNLHQYDTTDFFSVAIHEIGHSLGFSHTEIKESVMHKQYKPIDKNTFKFTYDIIRGLYEMYQMNRKIDWSNTNYIPGTTFRPIIHWSPITPRIETIRPHHPDRPYYPDRPRHPDPRTRPMETTTIRNSPKITTNFIDDFETIEKHMEHDHTHNIPGKVDSVMYCNNKIPDSPPDFCAGKFDSAAVIRGELYIFKQGYLLTLKKRGQLKHKPQKYLYSVFRNKTTPMLNCIDAVYERPNDHRFVMFTGAWYWVFDDNMNMLENSPQPITKYGIPEYVTKIDAVMVKDGKTFLFETGKYWRFDDVKKRLDEGYPRSTSFFLGLPSKIDAAFTWTDNTIYFLKDNEFWSLNEEWKRVENLHGQSASEYWLNCDH